MVKTLPENRTKEEVVNGRENIKKIKDKIAKQ
jgi:hypothetical protein